jgi:hypothetical protein
MGYEVDGIPMDTLVRDAQRRRFGLPPSMQTDDDPKDHGHTATDASACPDKVVISPVQILRMAYTFLPTIFVCLLFCAVVLFVDQAPLPTPSQAPRHLTSMNVTRTEGDPPVRMIALSVLRCKSEQGAERVLRLGREELVMAAGGDARSYQVFASTTDSTEVLVMLMLPPLTNDAAESLVGAPSPRWSTFEARLRDAGVVVEQSKSVWTSEDR